jgi:thiosulfate/3-mercaptopyruvate sulfurtransferase
MNRSDVLISAAELLRLQASSRAPRLLDVRWTLPKPDGRDDFAAGHIPGAIYVDLDTELADHANTEATAGRHPLPSAGQFQDTVRSWGIDSDTEVVVYDDNSSLGAARAWWLLRWAGTERPRARRWAGRLRSGRRRSRDRRLARDRTEQRLHRPEAGSAAGHRRR